MFENERTALRRVALRARLMFRGERCAAAFDRRAFVRIVAIAATDLSLQNRMVVGQVELASLVQMTLKTGLRRFFRIDDRVVPTAALIVYAAWAVAGFATQVDRIRSFGLKLRVRRGGEILGDVSVTFLTAFRPGKLRARDCRRSHDRPLHGRAGNGNDGKQDGGENSCQAFPMGVHPFS